MQAAGDRTTLKKKKLLQALRPGEKLKTTDKTTKVTSIKKKPEKGAADAAGTEKSAASGDTAAPVKKKKKKIEVTTASPIPEPASKPVFTQQ